MEEEPGLQVLGPEVMALTLSRPEMQCPGSLMEPGPVLAQVLLKWGNLMAELAYCYNRVDFLPGIPSPK